ncbi:MAG: EamA family transporter [Geminicoccales bacterium]
MYGLLGMEAHVFAIVLLAALFHATWNAFIKVDSDRLLFMAVLMASGGIGALSTTLFLPPPDVQSWPYIALSILLHQGYVAFLLLAYRFGDLSHVYPLARGSAPLIVAVFAMTLVGETLTYQAFLAVVTMGVGIMSLSLTRGAQNLRDPWAVFFALGTGLFIAGYTLTDGVGARLAGSAHSYSAWMLGLEWIPIVLFTLSTRKMHALQQVGRIWKPALLMGLLSLAAYWAVIWAMTVAPIALVAALRETSIIFAVLFGVLFLKERLSLVRLAATMSTLAGAVLLKVSRP